MNESQYNDKSYLLIPTEMWDAVKLFYSFTFEVSAYVIG